MTPGDDTAPEVREASRASERMQDAEERMREAETLLDIATRQLGIAARNIANANAAEREYRRTIWHYSQLMRHRISNPLQTIIGMADTLRDMPDLDAERRTAMLDAIAEQARVLRDISLEPRSLAPSERDLRPEPMREIVRIVERPNATEEHESETEPRPRSPFTRFPPRGPER